MASRRVSFVLGSAGLQRGFCHWRSAPIFPGSRYPGPVVNSTRKAVVLVQYLPPARAFSTSRLPHVHCKQDCARLSPLGCPAPPRGAVAELCWLLQEAARLQNAPLEAGPWPACACLKLFFGNGERQVYFQLIQARQCRPRACSELGRACTFHSSCFSWVGRG